MTKNPHEPKLPRTKLHAKPIKLLPKIKLFAPSEKIKLTPVTALWPKKDEENDGLPEPGTGQ